MNTITLNQIYWAAALFPVNLFKLFLLSSLCGELFPADRPSRKRLAAVCASAALLMMLIDLLPVSWWLNAFLSCIPMACLFFLYSWRGTGKRIIIAAVLFALLSLSDALSLKGYLFIDPSAAGNPGPLRKTAGIFAGLLIIFILAKLFMRLSVGVYRDISTGWFLLFLAVPAACLTGCLYMAHLLARYSVTLWEEFALIFTGAAMLFACLAAFSLFESLVRHMEISRDYQHIQLRREMENEHYSIIQRKNDEYAETIHDIKHHLRYLSQLAAEEDTDTLRKYLADLCQQFEERSRGVFTDDRILNVILCEKAETAKKKGIDFQADLTASVSFLNPVDVCALMGNLLDNAIEGAETAEGSRFIRLQIRSFNTGFTVIRTENSFSGRIRQRGKKLLSTKKGGRHGYGMHSIRQIAEKTGGSMDYKITGNVFQTTVLLNMILPAEDDSEEENPGN